MDDRRLTLIVVPHGDLETRTFEIAYWKLRAGLIVAVGLLLLIGFVVATWFPVAAQAGRVPGLVRQLDQLESERAQVAELAEALAEVEAQYERVRQLLGADGAGTSEAPALPPIRRDTTNGSTVPRDSLSEWPLPSAGFVTRPQSTSGASHPGVDIAVPSNTLVRAAGAGIVLEAGEDPVYGSYVLLSHGDTLESLYGHASRILVRAGDRVRRGEVIALSGSSGQSSGPHLHFEVRKNGEPVDPMLYVRQPGSRGAVWP
jgi:murein DD-endopeptidase MepM/ murein hydrolase activator NlpD